MPSPRQATTAASAALVLTGCSAVLGQIVLMRELIVACNGNELSLGVMLAIWLFWTAIGSALPQRWIAAGRSARSAVAALECLLGLSLPPTLWALRAGRSIFQTIPGELLGPAPMLLIFLLCLSVFCILAGQLFVASTRLLAQERNTDARDATATAYLLESAGAGAGGVLASVVLLRCCNGFQIAFVILLLNAGMAAVLLLRLRRRQVISLAAGLAVAAVYPLAVLAPRLEQMSQQRLWQGFHLLGTRDSQYGNLAVIATGETRSIYDNGVLVASAPDASAAEESVHYALLQTSAPRQVLLLGGGVNGSISEALKHPALERLDYVELDPALLQAARRYLPEQYAALQPDARAHIHLMDGRRYLLTTHDSFDAILLNLPDPQSAQLNRFYTEEFFAAAARHLNAGGVLALQLRSSEDYISADRAELLRCILHTLRQVFPYVAIIPGDPIHFIAALQPGALTEDPQALIARLRQRRLQTRYVREYFLPWRMSPERMAGAHQQLQPTAATPVNHDFAPIAYYFDIALWTTQFYPAAAHWLQSAAKLRFTRVLGWAAGLLLLFTLPASALPHRERVAAAGCVAATGYMLMTLQIFLLLTFQAIYGYVYQQLAILIAMFMGGIALGCWAGHRRGRGQPRMLRLAVAQCLLALAGPVIILLAVRLSQLSGAQAAWLTAQIVFPLLAVICGALGGHQFPVASAIFLRGKAPATGMGTMYAIDLLGGCAGALLVSTYLIPVFGFWQTAWLSALLTLAPALMAAGLALRRAQARPAESAG